MLQTSSKHGPLGTVCTTVRSSGKGRKFDRPLDPHWRPSSAAHGHCLASRSAAHATLPVVLAISTASTAEARSVYGRFGLIREGCLRLPGQEVCQEASDRRRTTYWLRLMCSSAASVASLR